MILAVLIAAFTIAATAWCIGLYLYNLRQPFDVDDLPPVDYMERWR